jgi:hypothetical protein
MTEVWIIMAFCVALIYWQAAARAKEVASIAARKECKVFEVQLLDDTVQLVKLSMSRDVGGRWRIWREYRFEYATDGEVRYKGQLTILGPRVIRIFLETFKPVVH